MIRETIKLGCDRFGVPELTNNIIIKYSNRMTRTVACAGYNHTMGYGTIKISRKLFPTIVTEEEKINTILHEVAHVITQYLYPGKSVIEGNDGHGPTWQSVCRKIGCRPTRYMEENMAAFKLYSRKVRRLRAKCGCTDGVVITLNVYTKMRKGYSYKCRKCGCKIYS